MKLDSTGIKQMLTDHTIVTFAGFATPLTLNTRRLFALLNMSRGV
jgi:hypothetical protein